MVYPGVQVLGVASIYDDVTFFQKRQYLSDEGINGSARFDEHHDPAWLLEFLDHLLNATGSDNFCAWVIKGGVVSVDRV